MLPIKRKLNSAVWRLKQATIRGYRSTLKFVVETLTEKYWLLDYLPTFAKRKEGVLLVRLDLIGDFVLWLDSAQAYRQIYPNKKITLAVNSACAELARFLPHWDEVISVDVHQLRTNYLYRIKFFTRIRWYNYNIAIQPTFSRELIGDLTVRASCAAERFGYEGDTNNISETLKATTDRWYTKLAINDPDMTMELNRNAQFVRQLGYTAFLSNIPVIPLIPKLQSTLTFTTPYILVAPGASWSPKMWPIDSFAELLEQIRSKFKLHVVLCGGENDRSICETLNQKLGQDWITNAAGNTTLAELVELIRHAKLVISNDSSPVHIAAAVGTPSVCILGGGHFGRFLPYKVEHCHAGQHPTAIFEKMECFNCYWRCKFLPEAGTTVPCVTGVTTNQVFKICEDVLRRHSNEIR